MVRRLVPLAVVVLVAAAGLRDARAQAAPDAEIKAAFTAFVDGVAAGKPLPASVELFTPPGHDGGEPLPDDLAPIRKLLDRPRVKVRALVVSPGKTAAWIAAEITAKVPRDGKPKKESLRASAFLVKDGGAWAVRATHWSAGVKNVVDDGCGALHFEWEIERGVPARAEAPVKAVLDAFASYEEPKPLVGLLSDERRAFVFGSAPRETFAGGARIKSLFANWDVRLLYWDQDRPGLPARAGLAPGGDLLWMTAATTVTRMCTSYRSFFVLAKERAGWRIVHHHYSEPISLD
ncbi:MAG: nuclear transport factor 2 family protein [Deltaproteobacteria bacterium]|nr:nuclear transport factor 2 family protein [Kofleriaceae bacterium]